MISNTNVIDRGERNGGTERELSGEGGRAHLPCHGHLECTVHSTVQTRRLARGRLLEGWKGEWAGASAYHRVPGKYLDGKATSMTIRTWLIARGNCGA